MMILRSTLVATLGALTLCLVGAGPARAALPTLTIADASGLEGDSGATFIAFPVTLSAPSASDVTVNAAAAYGTTTSDDHKLSTGVVTIPAGQTSATFSVAIFGDVVVEPDETFTVTLSEPVGATLARATAIGTILNDDALGVPVARVANVEVPEGNDGTTSAVFTVTLAPAPTGPVTIDYETQDGTATVADLDYVAASGTLSFAAGETTKTFSVQVKGDTRAEPNEILYVVLENPAGAKVGGGGSLTIHDDDQAPELSIEDVSVNEGQSGTTPANFKVTLSAPYPTFVQVKFEVGAPATLCDGLHWISADDIVTPVINVVTLAAGQTSAQVTILVNGDTVAEHDEIFRVTLVSSPLPVKRGVATGTIVNDDGTPPTDPPCIIPVPDGGSIAAADAGVVGTAGQTGGGTSAGAAGAGGGSVDAGAGPSSGTAGAGGGSVDAGAPVAGEGAAGAGGDGGTSKPPGSTTGGSGCGLAGSRQPSLPPLIVLGVALRLAIRRRRVARRP